MKESAITMAIWRAQAANSIGRTNATKRAMREGMRSAASHIANELHRTPEARAIFMRACGF